MTDSGPGVGWEGGSSSHEPKPGDRAPEGQGAPEGPGGPEGPPPPLSEFIERPPSRLALEAALGSAAGLLLGPLLVPGAAGVIPSAVAGAILAPLSLLLTPLEGGIMYRAFRYGIALAVLVTLVVSFVVGADVLPLNDLLVIALFVFAAGTVGHGIVAAVVDPEPPAHD